MYRIMLVVFTPLFIHLFQGVFLVPSLLYLNDTVVWGTLLAIILVTWSNHLILVIKVHGGPVPTCFRTPALPVMSLGVHLKILDKHFLSVTTTLPNFFLLIITMYQVPYGARLSSQRAQNTLHCLPAHFPHVPSCPKCLQCPVLHLCVARPLFLLTGTIQTNRRFSQMTLTDIQRDKHISISGSISLFSLKLTACVCP